jgi:branched-chain amino acid transport system substrate-binding protein
MASAPLAAVDLVAGAAPAGAASATPVVIGEICSCTGPLASTTQQVAPVIQAWASWTNAHGGLNGHPVTLTEVDDTTSPSVAIADVQKFISVDHVAAIFDNSEVDTEFASVAASAGVPLLGTPDTDLSYNDLDSFDPGPTLNYGDTGQLLGIKYLTPYKKEAVFYCVEEAVCASESHIEAVVGQRYGITVTYTTGISFSAPNYTAQCLAAKESGAQVLEIGDASSIAETAATNCAAQGWSPIEISAIVANNMATDPQFNGMIASQQDIPWFVHNSATNDFYAALDKYAPTIRSNVNFGQEAIFAWAEGELLQAAIKAAAPSSGKTITSAVVKKGLYNLPAGETLGGITAQAVHFTKGQYANASCWDYITVKNGKFVWANHEKPLCGYLVKPGANEGAPFLKPLRSYEPGEAPSK